jgi:hypothetical protein
MRRLLPLAVALALLAGCGDDESSTSASDPIAAVSGTWQGTLHQKDTKPFPIEVTIASADDPDDNVVNYGGSIDCSGTWRYLGSDGDTFEFEEVIDSGQGGACKGRGRVTVRHSAEELDYEFRGGGVESRGTLEQTS